MGFIKGQEVEVLLNAPLHDPVKYKIMGYEVSLRHTEASMIEIITESEARNKDIANPDTTEENGISVASNSEQHRRRGSRINILCRAWLMDEAPLATVRIQHACQAAQESQHDQRTLLCFRTEPLHSQV